MILVDLDVLLDVMQQREPPRANSAAVLEAVIRGDVRAVLSAHAVTTIHHVVERYNDKSAADRAVDWLLRHFSIGPVGQAEFVRARALALRDFEDAVVVAVAEAARVEAIVTRNVKDFARSPVEAMTPDEWLLASDTGQPAG